MRNFLFGAIFVALFSACRLEDRRPDRVETVAGPVSIERIDKPVVDSIPVLGAWFWSKRKIVLAKGLSKEAEQHTLYHELCHVALDAAGTSYIMADSIHESVCDAIATARMHEKIHTPFP